MNIGYYWVKHFNYPELKIMYFNGFRFEIFPSDNRINDEIESYIEVAPPDTMEGTNLHHTTGKLFHGPCCKNVIVYCQEFDPASKGCQLCEVRPTA